MGLSIPLCTSELGVGEWGDGSGGGHPVTQDKLWALSGHTEGAGGDSLEGLIPCYEFSRGPLTLG